MNPLQKSDKLKRFSRHVVDTMAEKIGHEIEKTDCLGNGDIYTKRDLWEKIKDIAECASLVELRKYDTGEIRVHNANFCHNPVVCPICADRVSKRRRAIFSEPIKRAVRRFGVNPACGDWRQEWPREYTGVYLATATIRDGPKLKERLDLLINSLLKMRKKGQKRKKKKSLGEWSKITAAIQNIEMKIGRGSGSWHVHAHLLLFTDSPLDLRIKDSGYFVQRKENGGFGNYDKNQNGEKIQLSKYNYEWFQSTGGEGINFDVVPIRFLKNVHGNMCETFEESVVLQAQEVIKYPAILTKKKGIGLLSAAQYVELIQRRGNRRLFNPIGLMRCDKRNPDSFMTISERELKRLEYVEELDSHTYEIFASMWQNGGTYSIPVKQDAALFSSSDDLHTRFINLRRRAFVVQTAKFQGEYRKERSALFKWRDYFVDKDLFESLLDNCRDFFRRRVSSLWEKYSDMNFLPQFLCDFDSTGMAGLREKYLSFSLLH
jgi:hypothetical protein